ncbi:sterol carrier family protein [Phaeacidiphilus oryzae]|uniref:sterol carrier family protein n=1 Tax=Phaeacidiphilus oryzae TaxID=348818 RepID=UPI00056D1256|nr:sterol carrier family protein [Phaeacidiphilus oryzae]
MPQTSRRARTYHPAAVRSALAAEFTAIREQLAGLTEDQLLLPTRLGDWTVRELAVHLGFAADAVERALTAARDTPPAGAAARPLDLTGWVRGAAEAAQAIDETVRERAAGGAYDPVAAIDHLLGQLPDLAGQESLLVPTRLGTLRLADFLVTRLVESVVHADDLTAALQAADPERPDFPHDRQALAAVVRLLADTLAEQAPGGSVELRIPPFAVVQCVEGPRHTRGTPPNVVETSPLVWVRLATGRLTWEDAVEVAELTASGERSDLSALLPVMA